MGNTIQDLQNNGQSIWCDNISRSMIDTGELNRLIDLGVVGVTSNPTIFMKAITGGSDYDTLFHKLMASGKDQMGIYEGLVMPDIADAADALRPVYDRTHGVDQIVQPDRAALSRCRAGCETGRGAPRHGPDQRRRRFRGG